MVATSDIPDWCYIESGLDFNLSNPPILSPQQYKTMFSKSPASVAHLVTSPVLVMLGEGDRRVPPMEGLRWGQYLKSNGVDATIVKFNEVGHALDSVPAEKYGFDCYMDFLKKHLMCV